MATLDELPFDFDPVSFVRQIDDNNLFKLYQSFIFPIQKQLEIQQNQLEENTPNYLLKISSYSSNPKVFIENSVSFLNEIKISKAYSKIILQLWTNSPENIIQFINDLNDEILSRMIKFIEFESLFTYSIGNEEDLSPIYFLYDNVDDNKEKIVFDTFLKIPLVTNGPYKLYSQDYHLSWPTLFHIYFPKRKIIITSDKSIITNKYIYVLTFDYFQKFVNDNDNNNSELPPIRNDVLLDASLNKSIIIWNDCHESADYDPLFNWWNKSFYKKNITRNAFVFSGEQSNQLKFNHKKNTLSLRNIFSKNQSLEKLNFYTLRYFEEAVKAILFFQYPDYSFEERLFQLNKNQTILKHFLCFNRVIKDYRVILSYLFFKNNFLEISHISQRKFNDSNDYEFGHHTNYSLNQLIDKDIFEKFKDSLPWTADTNEFKTNHWNTIPINIFEQSFVWITTETEFGKTSPENKSFLTEKTYKPIAFFVPFIIVGTPLTLKTLRDEGYKTFSKWWDESYDSEFDPLKRMKKIEKILIEISKLNQNQLLKITSEMREVLQHNHQHLLRVKRSEQELNAVLKKYDQ